MRSINYALLLLGCLLFHVAGTWSIPLIDRDEPRFAEASREMIERGDYIVPHFNNQQRLDKPPLAYWAQVVSFRIFGENDFAARFPSAVAAALVALSILGCGKRIGGDGVGWWAAIIFTLSLQTFLHAKAAVADMWLVLFMTTAHWAGYELFFGKRSTSNAQRPTLNSETLGWWLCFYVALALGFLAKGPIAWTPLLMIAAVKFFVRDVDLAKRFKFVRGILLMLAIVALWGVPALIQTHGDFFRIGIGRHVVGRSFGAMEGHGSNSIGVYLLLLPFYFVTVFASFFPWSIKLPAVAKKLWRDRDKIDIYLLTGTAIIFVIFTLIKTKLPHYTLPAFPLLALLLARHLVDHPQFLKRCAIVAASTYLVVALFVAPSAARAFPAAQLFRQTRDQLRPEMEFGAVDFQEPSLVWYFRSRIKGWMTPLNSANAAQFMEKGGARFVILPTTLAAETFPDLPATWKSFTARGFNVAKGKDVDLTLVLKPD
ncbi:MAG TPA: glycosyltransferase family 39 protein [Chthoniobacterales bacterium]|nr:glycosyltransferase family 39 protein [Chthoniobacterales bacterium]